MAVDLAGYRGVVRGDVALAPLTTYRFGGAARYYAEVSSRAELGDLLAARGRAGDVPLLVLGRGSNVVVSDAGFDGIVVRLVGAFLEIGFESGGVVSAGAGVTLPRLARETVKAGRGGLEWCVGIPGSVGGAVRMNAGGHGSDTAAWLIDADLLDASGRGERRLDAAALELGYRHSGLGDSDVVLGARYRTIARPRPDGERLLREITRWRRVHQPGGTLNAGSVFKNPEGDAAGRIIDSLGLKGFRVGGASVSTRHANFFVADAAATAQDVFDLVAAVRRRVLDETGIALEPEIRFVGRFRSSGASEGGEPWQR